MDIGRLDLNLLRVFEALHAERHVTRAGARLGLTQSAVSNALKRLRLVFQDDLFQRTPRGMEPTALARELASPVATALDAVRAALDLNRPFDPARAQETFRIGVSDQAEFVLGPPLVGILGREAPGVTLVFRHADRDVALALLDVQMPGMDGFQLAEYMRGAARTRHVPIIFVTAGSADVQRRFRGYEAGAVDFIQKPIEGDILRSKAEVFFDLYDQRRQVLRQHDERSALRLAVGRARRPMQQFLRDEGLVDTASHVPVAVSGAHAGLRSRTSGRRARPSRARRKGRRRSGRPCGAPWQGPGKTPRRRCGCVPSGLFGIELLPLMVQVQVGGIEQGHHLQGLQIGD